jgi:uncharacterized membrane protein YeaQ/YmgE (transglycosylase-associated protein family)
MGIILWIVFGALAGWIASMLMGTDSGQGTGRDIIMGIIGSMVGGLFMNMVGWTGVTGFNLYSLFVAVAGAVVVIYIARMIRK